MKRISFVSVTNYTFWICDFSVFTAWSTLVLEKIPQLELVV